jgi:hypothetical protein
MWYSDVTDLILACVEYSKLNLANMLQIIVELWRYVTERVVLLLTYVVENVKKKIGLCSNVC